MPLHADHPPVVVLPLHSLHYAIGRMRNGRQPIGKSCDGLMVKGIDPKQVSSQGDGEPGSRLHMHVVNAAIARPGAVVLECMRPLGGDVLHQRPSQRDVHDLNSAADCQGGKPASMCGSHERELECIALSMDLAKGNVRRSSVVSGIEVFPACEDEPLHALEHRVGIVWMEHRQDERSQTGLMQRIGI